MLETLRPRLVEGTRARRRSDHSWGVQLGGKGSEAELAADQDSLFSLIDGRRSLSEIAEAHLTAHRSMPFSALRDLLGTLAARGLLANSETDRAQAGFEARLPRLQRAAHARLASLPLPGGAVVTFGLLVVLLALGAIGSAWPAAQVSSFSVLLSYVGASLALSARSLTKAAALSAFGEPPRFLHVVSTFGVVHLALDTTSEVLLDQRPRAVALVAAFCGPALLVLAGQARPGIEFGAALVLFFDFCPFAPTSFGRLLATLAGKVDLREHARAYLTRRLLKRVISTHFFEGEWSLVTSSLLSLAWVCLGVRLLLTHGAASAILLVRYALDAHGADRALSLAGAAILVAAVPLALGGLVATLGRAVGAFVPNTARAGEHAGAVEAVDLDAVPLFMRLSTPEREAIAGAARMLRFPAGSRIVIQGELGDRFFAIRSGEVVVERELASGLVKEIARLGPGDCFGETALLEKKPRTATVRALSEIHALVLSQDDFAKVRGQLSGDDVTALLRASAGLHRNALFSHLAAERLSALAMQLRPRTVEAGEEIVREGDSGDAFYLVESGQLEVTSGGKRVGTLGPGEHFGEVALLRDVPRTATVRALEASLLLALDKQRFIAAIASDLSLSAQLEEVAAARAGSAR
jgi:CRP-like cAMP-binding protein